MANEGERVEHLGTFAVAVQHPSILGTGATNAALSATIAPTAIATWVKLFFHYLSIRIHK